MINALLIIMLASCPAPQTIEYHVLHDARAVHDTAMLNFDKFTENSVSSWVVATVTKGSKSGSVTIPGAYIKSETGEMVVPGSTKTVLVKEGRWKSIASGSNALPVQGNYSWLEPLQEKRVLLPEDFYSPFTHGGIIICRFSPGAVGADQFRSVHLLIPEYVQYVSGAAAIAGRERLLFDGVAAPARLKRLEHEFMISRNKLIMTFAFRTLLSNGQMTPGLVRTLLSSAQDQQRAIATFLLISKAGMDPGDTLLQQVISLLENGNKVAEIRPVVLGAFSAGLFGHSDKLIVSRSNKILNIAYKRLRELRAPIEKEPDLLYIFHKMDIAQR